MSTSKTDHMRRAIAIAVRGLDPRETEGGNDLSVLSNDTQFESVEVFDDEISISGRSFSGPIVWHVELVYRDADGDIRQSDSFPGTVTGRFDGEQVVIEHMTADTRSFYQ
ncbi:hypothetical protein [Bosea caraganae]|nr:hypothetical protein [Bosea caraganae]